MSGKTACCQKPKELKVKPQECTPEQIKKCHGDGKGHPCVLEPEEKKEK